MGGVYFEHRKELYKDCAYLAFHYKQPFEYFLESPHSVRELLIQTALSEKNKETNLWEDILGLHWTYNELKNSVSKDEVNSKNKYPTEIRMPLAVALKPELLPMLQEMMGIDSSGKNKAANGATTPPILSPSFSELDAKNQSLLAGAIDVSTMSREEAKKVMEGRG